MEPIYSIVRYHKVLWKYFTTRGCTLCSSFRTHYPLKHVSGQRHIWYREGLLNVYVNLPCSGISGNSKKRGQGYK